jgi:hypothetical protein
MSLVTEIEQAVENGWDIVCSPLAYDVVLKKVRELEAKRDEESIMSGRGPSLAKKIRVEWHNRQWDPHLLAFDDYEAFRDYLKDLSA